MNSQDNRNSVLKSSLENVFAALGTSEETKQNKLTHNLLLTIHRRQETLDWLLGNRASKVRGRTSKVLYWAMVEILWMSGVPAPAVVDTAVSFVKKRHSQSEASFVNAFLRKLVADFEGIGLDGLLKDAPGHVRHDLPEFLWKRWTENFGDAVAEELATVLQQPAKVILRRRTWPPRTGAAPQTLQQIQAPAWAPWAELYTPTQDLKNLDEIMGDGTDFYIQDMATLLAPSLMAPVPGEDVADLCAAPGGKALILGEMLKGKGTLLCADKASSKLERLRQNLAGIDIASFECLDAANIPPNSKTFDAILLDVPCSNSGVIRRKPDVRAVFTPQRITELSAIQSQILENAATLLKPRGRIVYSTCSIEKEENDDQVQAFLSKHPEFKLKSSRTILPSLENDGAYAALIVKV